jgi:hypothetical protein
MDMGLYPDRGGHRPAGRHRQFRLAVNSGALSDAKKFSRRLENRISSAAMDIQHFISRAQLSLTSEPADTNPDLHPDEVPEGCDHYTCALRGRTLGMTFHFTCPRGEGPPLIKDTVRYLGAVAAEFEGCDDLTDWADEYGFDAGHMDTRGAYDAIARLTRDLWQMIGDDLYDELRRDVEIEQAVDMAWAGFESSGRS